MFSEFAAAHAPGIAILEDCARHASLIGISDLAHQSGMSETYIRSLLSTYKRLKDHADAATGIPVHILVLVARWAKKMQPEAIPTLLAAVRGRSYDEAEDHLRAAVNEYGKPHPPRGTVGVAKRPDIWGRRRITFHLTDAEWAHIREQSRPFIEKKRDTHTFGQALDIWLKQKLLSPSANSSPIYKPVLLIPVDRSLIWDRGYLVTADGARITPEEALKGQLDNTGWVLQTALDADGVAHATAVAPIQDTRYSTGAHRMIANLETLICSWPGCHRPAAECQSHHIDAWSRGGETSWDNLTPLCATHNGMNDDDPEKENHGRIVRGNGGYPGHQRRKGDPIRYSGNDLLTSGWRGLTYDYYAARHSPPQP
ncbi:HNH endonuclease signature motif containing protein [Corynebacterium hindlerae]|uniref:HNH endonuclease signature motif containing protein n=1 Tax=Corynebacterium hindlerae TaxID=699041 RepID=UPI0031B6CB90